MEVKTYRYYDKENIAVDWEGLKADLEALPEGSVVLLQACVDPTHEQWDELSALMKRKNHLAFFDSAYQGFASGDADKDAYSLRKFEADGNRMMLSQSFAKNFGLYGERVGTLSVVCNDAEEQKRVLSQLKIVIRRMYSSPPLQGARIVAEVLGDEKLSKQWYQECAEMAERIKKTRSDLVEALKKDWSHIVKQIGMFSFTGLNPQQCEKLIKDHHIYLVKSGRISIAGVTSKNVDKLAKSIHAVTSE
ncbi:Got2 [Symbiodinium sp. KB8]|nr:Got2 [Symbiodinium sp. KB8]